MRGTTASVPLLALVVLALAGCGGGAPPEPTPTDPRPTPPATATPIPVPTPTETLPPEALDPLETVTSILLQTEILYFCDDVACAVDGIAYLDPPDFAIAKLTAVFGLEPRVETYEGYAGSTSWAYWWTDDFLLYFSTGGTGDIDHLLRVQVTAPSIGGVAIETEHGVHVGTPTSEALAAAEFTEGDLGEDGTGRGAHFDIDGTPGGVWTSIIAFGSDGGPITTLVGPITTEGTRG